MVAALDNEKKNTSSESIHEVYQETSDTARLTRQQTLLSRIATKISFPQPETKDNEPPYSIYTRREKFVLVILCTLTGCWSTIAAPIYYPSLTTLERYFHISEEQVNISVVVYFIFQGVSPSIMGGLADYYGRRPVTIVCVTVYFVSCVVLARANSYGLLLGMRCIQAAGIAPCIAINSGIMGDITTRAERGGYVGLLSGTMVLGSAFGALIGALLAHAFGWRGIFWFLAIGSGISAFFIWLLMPETKRSICGNGTVFPSRKINVAPILLLPWAKKKFRYDNPDLSTITQGAKLDLLGPLFFLSKPEIALPILASSIQFASWSTHSTALSLTLAKDYHLGVVRIGLYFLPGGISVLLASLVNGRIINWNYKRRFNQLQQQIESGLKPRDAKLNIFKVRLETSIIPSLFTAASLLIYGWCIHFKTSVAGVLIGSVLISLVSNTSMSTVTTLIVDLYPEKSSSGTGCLNLLRCLLSAAFIAALSSMMKKMTPGGTFSFLAGLVLIGNGLFLITIRYGESWKRAREERASELA